MSPLITIVHALVTLRPVFRRQAITSRFLVKLSSFSYGLLTTFIVQSNYLLIASIMNDRINFEKISDFPGITRQIVQFEVMPTVSSLRLTVVRILKFVLRR